jgi:hypothetical protein
MQQFFQRRTVNLLMIVVVVLAWIISVARAQTGTFSSQTLMFANNANESGNGALLQDAGPRR